MTLFPELEPEPAERRALVAAAKLVKDPSAPCRGCPLSEAGGKLHPQVPSDAAIVVLSSAPSENDERERVLYSGRVGGVVRAALAAAGVDPELVGYANLTRCAGDAGTSAWESAEKRCRSYLDADLPAGVPLLLLGAKPLHAMVGSGRASLGATRGLWIQVEDGRDAFVARDPQTLCSLTDEVAREALLQEFSADVGRMADHLLGREPASPITFQVFESPFAAASYLEDLARRTDPWAFDLETYDGVEFPSRKGVSTDACHPDFRLRGIAIATSATEGAWVECKGYEGRVAEVRALLDPAFGSCAAKWAFWGHFDDEGLVYPGWVTEVRNRAGDGGLALLSLSDGAHESLRLEHAVVNVLKDRQYWNGMDKSKMRDVQLAVVAHNAVGDACYTFKLCELLHGRLERGEYFMHRRVS